MEDNKNRSLRILRLIDNFSLKNAGVWKVATATCGHWGEDTIYFTSKGELPIALVDKSEFFVSDWENENWDVIESHGVWQWNTKSAFQYSRKHSIPWIAVPHGMLEPWSMCQKRLKKWLYYALVEGPLLRKANAIKAVSQPEADNLKLKFGDKVCMLYNPVELENNLSIEKAKAPISFVFLGRLHHKKNPVLLLESWVQSGLDKQANVQLLFAGPDDGAMQALKDYLAIEGIENVKILGALYGAEKEQLLQSSHIFVLPSQSEGLPSTAVEALHNEMHCVLSSSCNFPEAFAFENVMECGLTVDSLSDALLKTLSTLDNAIDVVAAKAFVGNNFSVQAVLKNELNLYHALKNRP